MERLRELSFLKRMPNTEKPAYFEVRRIQNDRVGQRIHQIEQDIYVGTGPAARNKEETGNEGRFCELTTELADASHAIQAKVNDEEVRILEPERLDTGKFRVLYSPGFDEEVEDAFELYRRVFLPRMQAARANGEVPGLSTPK